MYSTSQAAKVAKPICRCRASRICSSPPITVKPSALRPLGPRSYLRLAVHLKVHLLVEEAQVTLYLGCLRYGLGVAPDEVLHALAASLDGPVRRLALVRAPGVLPTRDALLQPDVLRRHVVARR